MENLQTDTIKQTEGVKRGKQKYKFVGSEVVSTNYAFILL
jgi:hypothetical protein